MRKITLLLGVLISISFTAFAQNTDVLAIKKLPANSPKMKAKAVATEENRTAYGMIFDDSQYHERGWASFDKLKPDHVSMIQTLGVPDFWASRAGAYADGVFYTYLYKQYSYETEPLSFGTVDVNTGEYTRIGDIELKQEDKSETVFSMTYDNTNKKMYALYSDRDFNAKTMTNTLATVDLETGAYTPIKELDHPYFTIAANYSGEIYAIAPKDSTGANLYKLVPHDGTVDENLVTEIKQEDGTPYAVNYSQDMTFDHTTWKLYWNSEDRSAYGLPLWVELDVKTGIMHKLGNLGQRTQMLSLYIPYRTADNVEAPNCVTNLTAVPADNGVMNVELSWTNPTTCWNNTDLAQMNAVDIYREGKLIHTVENAEKGAAMTYTDTNVPAGMTTYKLIPRRKANENGLDASVSCFVGKDVPGVVKNVSYKASDDGQSAILSWDQPETGKDGGWYDHTSLKYTVLRMPDSVVVSKNIVTTTVLDKGIKKLGYYSYRIIPSNAQGDGQSYDTKSLAIGPDLVTPYNVRFDNTTNAGIWTIYDPENNGYSWSYYDYFGAFISDNTGGANDWLFSPNIRLEAGTTYRIGFLAKVQARVYDGSREAITFMMGQGKSVEAMKDTLEDIPDMTNLEAKYYSYTVTPKETGAYNFGLHSYSDNGTWGIWFMGFSAEEVKPYDLTATSITGSREAPVKSTTEYTVGIRNKGSNTATNYNVQLVDEDMNVLAETSDVPELASNKDTTVVVKWTPAPELQGKDLKVHGKAAWNIDNDRDNDVSNDYVDVTLLEPDNSVWTTYEGQSDWDRTSWRWYATIPLNMMSKTSVSQVIYYKSLLNLSGDNKISKISYHYQFATDYYATFKVYMALTDREVFGEDGYDYIDRNNMTLVYDGSMNIPAGESDMIIKLDTPFSYDGTRNLCVMVERPMDIGDTYGETFDCATAGDEVYPAVRYSRDSKEFDWDNYTTKFTACSQVPITRFAITSGTETNVIGLVASDFSYSFKNGMLNVVSDKNISNVTLYNLNGSVCRSMKHAINSKFAAIDVKGVSAGVYLLNVNNKSVKVAIK